MNLLYLDLATRTGWAAGDVRGKPDFGCEQLPKKTGSDLGSFGLYFEDWLYHLFGDHMPDHVAFESPFIGSGNINLHTTRKLTGLCFVTEIICARENVPVSETAYSQVRVYALGDAKLPNVPVSERKKEWKRRMLEAAMRRGYAVKDDNEADAVMGWEYTAHQLWPHMTPHLKSFHELKEPRMEGV